MGGIIVDSNDGQSQRYDTKSLRAVGKSKGHWVLADLISENYTKERIPFVVSRSRVGNATRFDYTEQIGRTIDVERMMDSYSIIVRRAERKYGFMDSDVEDEFRVKVSGHGREEEFLSVERKRDVDLVKDHFIAYLNEESLVSDETEFHYQESVVRARSRMPDHSIWKGHLHIDDEPYQFTISQQAGTQQWLACLQGFGDSVHNQNYEEFIEVMDNDAIEQYYVDNPSILVDHRSEEIAALWEVSDILGHDITVIDSEHEKGEAVFKYEDGVVYRIRKLKNKYVVNVFGFHEPVIHQVDRRSNLDGLIQKRLLECEGLHDPLNYTYEIDFEERDGQTFFTGSRKLVDTNDLKQFAVEVLSRKTVGGFAPDASFRFEEIHNEKGNMSPVGGNYRVIVNSDAEELVYNVQIGRKGTRKWKYSISGPNFTSEGLRVNYTFSPWIHYRRSHASRFMEAADIERRGLRVLSGLQEVVRHDSAGVVMHTGGDTYFFMASAPLFSRGRIADEAVPVKERSKGLGSIPGRMLDFSREVHDWSIYGEFPALRRLMGPDGKCPSFRHLLYNTHGINQGSNLTTRAVHSTALKLLGSGFIYAYASVVVLRLLSTFGYTVYNRRARDHISAHDPKEKWDTLISNHLEVHWPLYQRGDVRSWVDFEQSLQNLFVKVSKKNGSSIQELAEKYLQIKSSIHEILEMAEGDLPSQYQSIRRLITDADIIGKTIPPELDNLLIKLRPLEFDSLTNHHLEWCEHLRDRGLLSNEYANKKDLDTVFQEWGEIYYQRLLGFETPTNVGPVRSPTMASKCLDDVLASFRGKVREESDEELDLMAGAALKKLDNANSLSIAGTVISYLPLVNFLGVTFDLGMYVAWTLLSNVHGGISGPYTNQASNRMAFHVYVSRKMATEAEHTMKAGVFQRAQNLWYLLGDSLVAGSVFLDQLVLKPLYGENAVQTFYPYFGLFGLGLASTVAGFAYYFKFHKQFKEDFGWEHEGLIDKVKKLGKKWGGRLSRRFRKEE